MKLGKSVQVVKTSVMNAQQDITPTSIFPVASHVQLESTLNKVFKPKRVFVSRVKLGPIPRREARATLIFVMHANQVGILQHHRIPLGVKNAQKGTCKTPRVLVDVNGWVKMLFVWGVVLLK